MLVSLIVSLILPLLSHITRQAVACADPPVQPFVYSSFLFCYAFAMCMHSMYADHMSLCHIRIALAFFVLSFIASIFIRVFTPVYFAIAWSVHAFPSSLLWPLGYRLVNVRKRLKTTLVLWSLQANVGDIIGCRYHIFDRPIEQSQYSILISIIGLVFISFAFVSYNIKPRTDAIVSTMPVRKLLFLVVMSTCVKTMTYSASNFMPTLHFHYYLYSIGGIAGTIAAGILADLSLTSTSLTIVSILLLCQTIVGYAENMWYTSWFCIAFGILSSFASTMLSICKCTDVAEMSGQYAKTTALLDSTSTALAAGVQLFAHKYFTLIQIVASSVLLSTYILSCLMSMRIPFHRTQDLYLEYH